MINFNDQETTFDDIWFFGVGINTYDHYACLHNAILDIKTIGGRLKADFFPNLIDKVVEDASLEDIIAYFDYLRKNVKERDCLIVYFAGHGYKDNITNRGFWIPKDAKKENRGLYIHNSVVIDYLEDIKAYHTLLIVDACFAGTIATMRATEYKMELEKKKSRWFLASGFEDEKVSDGIPGENSPFAKAMTKFFDEKIEKFGIYTFCDYVADAAYELEPNQKVRFSELKIKGHDGGQLVFRRISKEEEMYKECVSYKNKSYAQKYLDSFPRGKYFDEVLEILQEIECQENKMFEKCKTSSEFYKFIRNYPDNNDLVKKARNKINKLKSNHNIADATKRKRRVNEPELILVEKGSTNSFQGNDFYISKYPVMYEEYVKFCKAKKRDVPMKEYEEKDMPVVNITWFDAMDYADWLSKNTGKYFRLPTESEWEFAALGGILSKKFRYAGSNSASEVANFLDIKTSRKRLEPVKSDRRLNELGIADMSGNVWEWCIDDFDEYKMVIKGGSWMSKSDDSLLTNRLGQNPSEATDDIGFRLVTSDK